jgi:hypothetical protein
VAGASAAAGPVASAAAWPAAARQAGSLRVAAFEANSTIDLKTAIDVRSRKAPGTNDTRHYRPRLRVRCKGL